MNSLGIAYSLRVFIEENTVLPSIIKFDGIVLPKEKPYSLIENIQSEYFSESKQRETIAVTYRMQMGVFAESSYKLSEYCNDLTELFLFRDITYYDESGTSTGLTFKVEEDFKVVPIMSDNKSDDTSKHKAYFDIAIRTNKHRNK